MADPKTEADDVPPKNAAQPEASTAEQQAQQPGIKIASQIAQRQVNRASHAAAAPYVAAHAGVSAPRKKSVAIPERLPETTGTGYKWDYRKKVAVPFPVHLVAVGGFYLRSYAGYDFLLMRLAALQDNITLTLDSGFRTMKQQQDLWTERQQNKSKGPAAFPGQSNHQQGLSMDVHMGIEFEDWKSGKVKTNEIHTWLSKNAARFGFDQRDLQRLPDGRPWEPWHWTHLEDATIHGLTDPQVKEILSGVYDDLVAAGREVVYDAQGAPDILRILLKVAGDNAVAWSRSAATQTTSRKTQLDLLAAQAALQSAELHRKASEGMHSVLEELPKGFLGTLPLFDFTRGLWSDQIAPGE